MTHVSHSRQRPGPILINQAEVRSSREGASEHCYMPPPREAKLLPNFGGGGTQEAENYREGQRVDPRLRDPALRRPISRNLEPIPKHCTVSLSILAQEKLARRRGALCY